MNQSQRLALYLGIGLFIIVGLFPPFKNLSSPGRGDDTLSEKFAGHDFVMNGREGVTMSGGQRHHYPDVMLLVLHWVGLLVVFGGLVMLLGKKKETSPSEANLASMGEPGGP